jgi:hypothetical protein
VDGDAHGRAVGGAESRRGGGRRGGHEPTTLEIAAWATGLLA